MDETLSIALIALGIFILFQDIWLHLFSPWVFNVDGTLAQEGWKGGIALALLGLQALAPLGPTAGFIMLLVGSIALGCVDAERASCHRKAACRSGGAGTDDSAGDPRRAVRMLFIVAVVAHLVVAWFSWPFFAVEPGTSIRPMGYAIFLFQVSALSFFILLPMSIRVLRDGKYKAAGIWGCILSITPFFTGILIMGIAQSLLRFHLAH